MWMLVMKDEQEGKTTDILKGLATNRLKGQYKFLIVGHQILRVATIPRRQSI